MEKDYATWLSNRLFEVGISVPELARRSGISHSIIYRLVKGTYQPQSATLDALFNALETPEAERQCARALVQAPRTIQALQQEERLLIHKGDLFKELRLRQRLSQQALAQELNESVGYLPPSTLCLNSG